MAVTNLKVHKSQYHHYIPRFLLRRFSYPSLTVLNHGKRRNRKRRVDDVVTAVDLGRDFPEFVELPVGRIFGQVDMYKDDSAFTKKDQDRIETKLSLIEGQASRIIAKVADAHKAGKNEVTLSRHDKDLLRKYIFVMKYRSPIFYERFNHQRAEDYNSDDRTSFLEYMRKHSCQRPLDVWFHNLLEIMDKPMDPAGDWTTELSNDIYPGDAEWLYKNIRTMWLSFATPSDADEEFILTSNAFSIHEGPVDYSDDPFTGKQTTTACTEFHVISVVSPRLVMILRHSLLPEPLEDQHDETRNSKRWMLAAHMQAHNRPGNATSLLQDLPIAKARNSYTVIQDGRLELAEGADKVPKAADKFQFTFFRLESRHVQTINLVMLDQAHNSSHVVFKSRFALRAALDFYLDFPTQTRGAYSIKTITERTEDPMLLLLRKLETVAHSLGSSVRAKYYIDPLIETSKAPPPDDAPPFDEVVAQVWRTAKLDFLPNIPAGSIFALPMTVMVQTSIELKLNIMTIHALDQICIDDNQHCFSDLVFQAVQKAATRSPNEHTRRFFNTNLSTWKYCWDALVERALQFPGADVNQSVEALRNDFDQLSISPTPDALLTVLSDMSQEALRSSKEALVEQPGSYSDVEAAPGWSRRGLRQAFDDIGRDAQHNEATSTIPSSPDMELFTSEYRARRNNDVKVAPERPGQGRREVFDVVVRNIQSNEDVLRVFLIALIIVAFICFWLAVLAWRLIGLAWFLVQ